jgi:hypothetical protein
MSHPVAALQGRRGRTILLNEFTKKFNREIKVVLFR